MNTRASIEPPSVSLTDRGGGEGLPRFSGRSARALTEQPTCIRRVRSGSRLSVEWPLHTGRNAFDRCPSRVDLSAGDEPAVAARSGEVLVIRPAGQPPVIVELVNRMLLIDPAARPASCGRHAGGYGTGRSELAQ